MVHCYERSLQKWLLFLNPDALRNIRINGEKGGKQ